MKIEDRFSRLKDPNSWETLDATRITVPRPRFMQGRAVVAAAAAIVAIAGIAGIVIHDVRRSTPSTGVAGSATPALVPWNPLRAYTGAIRLSALKAAPPACRAGNLTVTATSGGGAGGTYYVPLTINNGGPACTLSGADLTAGAGKGNSVKPDGAVTVLMPTNGSSAYQLAKPDCVYHGPSGSGSPVVALAGIPLRVNGQAPNAGLDCPGRTRLVYDNPVDPEDAGTGPYSALKLALHAPADVTPGSTFDFQVSLTNTRDRTFTFATCPNFTTVISAQDRVTDATYTLNCREVRPLATGESVSFAMQAVAPDGTGIMKLGWFMQDGPSSGVVMNLPPAQ